MKKPLLALLLLASLVPAAHPQGSRSDLVMKNVKKLDVLIQIVPLALTKEQIAPLLLAIEKSHQKEKTMLAQEDKDLLTIEAKTQKVVDDAIKDGKYPPHETQGEIATFMRAMGMRRTMYAAEVVDIVYDACTKTLNAGQIKIMEKSLKPELLDPSLKPDTMDGAAKVKFFIRKVMLDPVAYDVLIEMSKQPTQPAPTPAPTSPSI